MPLVDDIAGLSHRIAARRLQLGKTQSEVETEARIAPTTLSRLESTRCKLIPRYTTIERIAKALKIHPDRLIEADPELDAFTVPTGRAKIAVIRNGADHRRPPKAKRRRRAATAA